MPAGLAWQSLPEPGALALVDTLSRRAAALSRPHPADLPIGEIVAVEREVIRWLDASRQRDAVTRLAAENALVERLAPDPMPALRAACWLLASWAVVLHLRTGQPPADVLGRLSFGGVWRGPQAPETERIWELLTAEVRTGAFAALTDDPATAWAFRAAATRLPRYPECLLHHSLVLMRGLWAELGGYGIEPRDMASTLAVYTLDPVNPATGSFRPLT
ncbi:MAG: hypothetical protein IRZ08_04570 [Frankia sp.]|nr:hypothetical protein [Frankia sp.]